MPAMWELFDRSTDVDSPSTADDDSVASLSRCPSRSSMASAEGSEHMHESGGSWPRIRKQRTSESCAMSLFEVAEALGTGDDDTEVQKATDELSCLAALVSAEEESTMTDEGSSSVSVESFVEAVFRGILPPEREGLSGVPQPLLERSATSSPTSAAGPSARQPSQRPNQQPSQQPNHLAKPTAADLALLEAIAADEAANAAAAQVKAAAAAAHVSAARLAHATSHSAGHTASPTMMPMAPPSLASFPEVGEMSSEDLFAMLELPSPHVPLAATPRFPIGEAAPQLAPLPTGPTQDAVVDEAHISSRRAGVAASGPHGAVSSSRSELFEPRPTPQLGSPRDAASPQDASPQSEGAVLFPQGVEEGEAESETINFVAQLGGCGPMMAADEFQTLSNDLLASRLQHALSIPLDTDGMAMGYPLDATLDGIPLSPTDPAGAVHAFAGRHGFPSDALDSAPKGASMQLGSGFDTSDAVKQEVVAGDGESLMLPLPMLPEAGFSAAPVGKPARNGAERKEWTPAEDEIIRTSVEKVGCRWRKIAAMLPGRSDDAVRNRWNRLREINDGSAAATVGDMPPLRATLSSSSEHGGGGSSSGGGAAKPSPSSGGRGSSQGGGREGRDGKEKPERVSWTKAEDDTILASVTELGHKWNRIAERLPGRTDHAIRNRFHRLQSILEDQQRHQQRTLAPSAPLPIQEVDGLTGGLPTDAAGFDTPVGNSGFPATPGTV